MKTASERLNIMVYKQERDRLVRERAKPVLAPAPTPPGVLMADLKAIGERQREHRIRYINERLYVAGGEMQRDRKKAIHQGRAKGAFNAKAGTPLSRTPSHSSAEKGHERSR